MKPRDIGIEEVIGFLGVGSLEVLGIFFILDGMSGFLTFVEEYAQYTTWAILVTIPLLIVSYLFGLLTSLGAEVLWSKLIPQPLTPDLFAEIVAIDKEIVSTMFLEVERQVRLLNGCFVAFLLLSIGSYFEVRMMAQFGFVGYLGAVGGLIVALLCPFMSLHVQKQFVKRVDAFKNAK